MKLQENMMTFTVFAAVVYGLWFYLAPASYFSLMMMPADLVNVVAICLLYTSPSPRDLSTSRMPSSA